MDVRRSCQLLTLKEVGERLRVSRRAVERLIAGGQLMKVKIGRCTRVPVSSVVELIDRHVPKAGA